MAIETINKENTEVPDSDYLGGSTKDDSGAGDGTPANKRTFNDFFEFFTKLLSRKSIVPNGLFENEYAGHQYHTALDALINDFIDAKVQPPQPWVNVGPYVTSPPDGDFAQAAWDNNGTANHAVAGYYKNTTTKKIELRGFVRYTAPSGTPIADSTIFKLPSGFRPPFRYRFCCYVTGNISLGTGTNGNQFTVEVKETGEVNLLAAFIGSPGQTVDIDLTPIQFRYDA